MSYAGMHWMRVVVLTGYDFFCRYTHIYTLASRRQHINDAPHSTHSVGLPPVSDDTHPPALPAHLLPSLSPYLPTSLPPSISAYLPNTYLPTYSHPTTTHPHHPSGRPDPLRRALDGHCGLPIGIQAVGGHLEQLHVRNHQRHLRVTVVCNGRVTAGCLDSSRFSEAALGIG